LAGIARLQSELVEKCGADMEVDDCMQNEAGEGAGDAYYYTFET